MTLLIFFAMHKCELRNYSYKRYGGLLIPSNEATPDIPLSSCSHVALSCRGQNILVSSSWHLCPTKKRSRRVDEKRRGKGETEGSEWRQWYKFISV